MRTVKIIYVRMALLLVLPLVYAEPVYREIGRAWRNTTIRAGVRRSFAQWLDYWRKPLDHISQDDHT
ncbi:hypothetical protein [Burkholderia gladioli]|uniref:hypothetical protein n=1 Tax=Burkholderia gladioli TaxID=28095 RepID=UPI001640BEED|nr:hypothetical protein [Burkholderia gladioli]